MGEDLMQGAEGAGEDNSFLDGWEETSPAGEEGGSGEDQAAQETSDGAGGDQTGGEEPDQESAGPAGDGDGEAGGPEGGENQAAHDGQEGGENQAAQQVPRTWTLNHLGQAVTANEADMVTLAQKGLDYDRIRSEYDEAKPVMSMFRDFAQRAGMDVRTYLAHIRTQAKQAEGMSPEEARRSVELETREAAVAAQEEARQQQESVRRQQEEAARQAEARRLADIREFQEIFPEAARNPQSIPPEVWAEVRQGHTLVSAYARYSAAQARARAAEEAQAAEQRAAAQRLNRQNAAKSTGSMRSAGDGTQNKDPFLEGWNE